MLRRELPTQGQILVNGRNVVALPPSKIPELRRSIGVVFQDFKLIRRKSALENVAYVLNVAGIPRGEQKRRAYLALKGVGLQHRLNVTPDVLSGGEQQRVAIARARRQRSRAAPGRRADRQSRSRSRRRDHAPLPRDQRARDDRGRRHARSRPDPPHAAPHDRARARPAERCRGDGVSAVLAHLRYFVSDAVDEWRHSPGPNLLATATLAAVLFVAGLNFLVLANLKTHVGRWKSDLRVSVYLVDGARAAEVDALYAKVAARARRGSAWSASTRMRPCAASARRSRTWRTCRWSSGRTRSRLPRSRARLRAAGARHGAGRGRCRRRRPAVEEIRYDQAFLDRIDALLDVARWGGAGLGLVVLTAVAFIVSGVLRLTVYARRDEIDIMHLVGAPPMLVRGPFLVAGIGAGLVGGLLALFLVEAVRRARARYVGAHPGELLDLAAGSPLPLGPSCFVVFVGSRSASRRPGSPCARPETARAEAAAYQSNAM